MPPMGSHGGMPPGSMPPGGMPPMGSHGGMPPGSMPPGNSCASIPDPVNRAECEKHIRKGPGTSGMPPGSMPPGGMPPMVSHGDPNDHHGDQDAAHCRAMGMADGSPHVDPPQAILDQVQAEYEANCQSGNCFLGEGNYSLLEGMGHTRAKVDCFLAEGHRQHDEQHGGPGDGNHPPTP